MWLDMCQKALTDPSMTDKTGATEDRQRLHDARQIDDQTSGCL